MVKECLVTLNNDAVTVVNFDGKEIQFPSIKSDANRVFVLFDKGQYSIVDKNYKETYDNDAKSLKKKVNKKTTFEENADNEMEITCDVFPEISE